MPTKTDTIHRVFPLPDDLRAALQATRERQKTTNTRLMADAGAIRLLVLVERLQVLGYGRLASRVRPGPVALLRRHAESTAGREPGSRCSGLCIARPLLVGRDDGYNKAQAHAGVTEGWRDA